jgi:hypothetical protein
VFFEKIYQKPLINKFFIRYYSSKKGASALFSGGSKLGKYLLYGTGALVSSVVSADVGLGTLTDEVPYLGRVYDKAKYGYYTENRGAREKMRILEEVGFDKSDFANKQGRLDYLKVHRTYKV